MRARLASLTSTACVGLALLGGGCADDQAAATPDAGPTTSDPALLEGVWELIAVPNTIYSSCVVGVEQCLRWEFTGAHFDAIGRLFNASGSFQASGGQLSVTDELVDPPRPFITSWRVDGDYLYTGVLTPVGPHAGVVGTWSSRDSREMPVPFGLDPVVTSLELRADGTYMWTLDRRIFEGTYEAGETWVSLTGDGPVGGRDLQLHDGWLWGAPDEGAKFKRQ